MPRVASEVSASWRLMPSEIRVLCSARVSPEGRGLAAVAAIAESVIVTWGTVGGFGSVGWFDSVAMLAPLGSPGPA
ncbi:hypothetical protein OHB11_38060 [Streptomyces zaomyceticus]|uniref:Uncharacterized protein n=1 Tax=Streptomyces zaomyceticus TaxID=68286 RepID=A0ABZ1LLK9_9ACTN